MINCLRKFYRINEQNKLHELFPARNRSTSDLRNMRKLKPVFKTIRFRDSFITIMSLRLERF